MYLYFIIGTKTIATRTQKRQSTASGSFTYAFDPALVSPLIMTASYARSLAQTYRAGASKSDNAPVVVDIIMHVIMRKNIAGFC